MIMKRPGLKIKTIISVFIGIIVLLLVSTLLFSLFTINRIKSNLKIQVNTRTVIITLKDNLTYLIDAETGGRGFVISADTNYLQPYNSALENIPENIRELRTLTKDNHVQQLNLGTLEKLISMRLLLIDKLVSAKKQSNEKAIYDMVATDQGKFYMDSIRFINKSMQTIEQNLYVLRYSDTKKSIARAKIIFIIEGFFAILITLFLAFIIIQELSRRTKAEDKINDYVIDLESKNKEIEQFAYIASHDLQEPLRSISNFSKLLAQKIDSYADKEASEYMNYISGGATRMSNLIFYLLEYSRVGKNVSKSAIDCNLLVQEILTDLTADIQESHAEIHVKKLPVVYSCDLKSVFQNLISNAIKFRKKDIPLVIHISATDKGKDFLFTIKDNGIGIEKEYHERIFIIFQRLHTRVEYEGTGIGLSQCKKIIEQQGGKIWIESEPPKGSTFYFTISKN